MTRYDNGVAIKEYASKGVAGAGLGLGIAGTALSMLGGNLGGLLGNGYNAQAFNEAHFESKEAAALRGENAELKAKIYADNVGTEVYKEAVKFAKENNEDINKKYVELAKALAENEKRFAVQEAELNCMKKEFAGMIAIEAERRSNGDKNLFNYMQSHYIKGKLVMSPDSICPPVMEKYNAWEAPTDTTDTTTTT